MNIRLMKTVDSILGRVAVSLLSAPLVPSLSRVIGSILLIRPGGIGDAVLLIPAIRVIRRHYLSAKITVLAERRNASVFRLTPEVDSVLLYDRPRDLVAALAGMYDAVIDTEQWHRLSAVVARLTRAPLLIGFATNKRSHLFTHPIAYSHDDYEADSFLHLLAPLGIEPAPAVGRFLLAPADAEEKGKRLLAPLGGRLFVAIFPGASIPERRWGVDRFRQVAEMLADSGISTVVFGGRNDQDAGEAIVSGGSGLNLAGRTSLAETAAIIDRSALLLSGDSGVLHIAAGLGIPTVSLFGPGIAKKWAPRGEGQIVINRGLSCSPCTRFGSAPPCPVDARCMKEITASEVFSAVTGLMKETLR